MRHAVELFYNCLEVLLIFLLASMAAMVFLNVVLRYGFNSGLNVSDELSRYFFVWLTFIGAVVAFRNHAHMGVETFVALFGRRGRVVCMIVTNVVIIGVSAVFFWGTWKQSPINASMAAPVTGLPMIWVYGIGFFTGLAIMVIALERIFRLLTGRITDEEIAVFAGEVTNSEHLMERGE